MPLYLMWIMCRLILTQLSLPGGVDRPISWWLWVAASDLDFVLPFLLFGSGIGLAETNAPSRQLTREAIVTAVSLAVFAYVLGAWVSPELEDRHLATLGAEAVEARRFGASTPPGIIRNIRFVEANPPPEYSLALSEPHKSPPNVLRWHLHFPVVLAVFGLANVFLGALAARLTANIRGNLRSSARFAIGLVGGMVFFAWLDASSPIPPFLHDGTLRSGTAMVWLSLTLPLIEGVVLFILIRRRFP